MLSRPTRPSPPRAEVVSHRSLVHGLATVLLSLSLLALGACGGDDAATPTLSAAGTRGRQVAEKNGCLACHTTDGARSTGPGWQGLAGSEVALADGTTVVADDAYLRRAVTDPKSEVVRGFANIMPTSYKLSDTELRDLVAYLHDHAAE